METRPKILLEIATLRDYSQLFSFMDTDGPPMIFRIQLRMNHLDTVDILILTQLCIYFWQRGYGISLYANDGIIRYLQEIRHIYFVEQNLHKASAINHVESESAMPIRRVEKETMVDYIQSTQHFMQSICPDKDLTMLDLCISELINNVYDHAQSPIGAYVFAQFLASKNVISLAVSDLGIGIPSVVNGYLHSIGEKSLGSEDCLKWAIKENKTTRSIPNNMGKGLDIVHSFSKANGCKWGILSADAQLIGYPSGNRFYQNPIEHFKGTIVSLEIPVENLPAKESVDTEGW